MADLREAGIPVLHVYCLPSFTAARGWTLYESGYGKDVSLNLHTVVWRQLQDIRRIREAKSSNNQSVSPEPTIDTFTNLLDIMWWSERQQELHNMQLPLVTKRELGMDGTFYGVSVPRRFALEWWCEGPPEWRELVTWTDECIDYFKSLLPEEEEVVI
jgi:hypothetical protein